MNPVNNIKYKGVFGRDIFPEINRLFDADSYWGLDVSYDRIFNLQNGTITSESIHVECVMILQEHEQKLNRGRFSRFRSHRLEFPVEIRVFTSDFELNNSNGFECHRAKVASLIELANNIGCWNFIPLSSDGVRNGYLEEYEFSFTSAKDCVEFHLKSGC